MFQVVVEYEDGGVRRVLILTAEDWGDSAQVALIGAEEFGPFDTSLEISQWVWRQIARHLDANGIRV